MGPRISGTGGRMALSSDVERLSDVEPACRQQRRSSCSSGEPDRRRSIGGGIFSDLLELGDGVDRTAHGDVGDALEDGLDDDRHAVALGELARPRQRISELLGSAHADGMAPQALDDADVVHAVAVGLRSIDVLEGELDLVVHVEVPLGLADQSQVGVVDDDVDVGDSEVRGHRQLLDEELEVVVPRERHHRSVRIGHARADRGGDGPPERTGLPRIDPVSRLEDVLAPLCESQKSD